MAPIDGDCCELWYRYCPEWREEALRERNRRAARERYAANPQSKIDLSRQYREANPEKSRERYRRYYAGNTDSKQASIRKYQAAHPEWREEYNRDYYRDTVAVWQPPAVLVLHCPRCGHLWRCRGRGKYTTCPICTKCMNIAKGIGVLTGYPF